jgi:hypothetical protein
VSVSRALEVEFAVGWMNWAWLTYAPWATGTHQSARSTNQPMNCAREPLKLNAGTAKADTKTGTKKGGLLWLAFFD